MLIRLAYTSQLRQSPDNDALITELISDAAVRNEANGITGIIALEGDRVCQILEGEKDAVERLIRSIRIDPRHTNFIELDRGEVEARHFKDWSMVRRPMVDMVMMAYSVIPARWD